MSHHSLHKVTERPPAIGPEINTNTEWFDITLGDLEPVYDYM